MQIFFGRFVTWIIASTLTIWTSYKAFWITGFLAFLTVSIYSIFLYALQDVLDTYLALMRQVVRPGEVSLASITGLAGWLLQCFKIPQCIVLVVDIIMLKWTLRKIPIIKW